PRHGRDQFLLPADAHLGPDLGGDGPLVELAQRLYRPYLVWACGVLRARRVYGDDRARAVRHHAVARHSARHDRRDGRRYRDRLSDLPSARPLFRALHARLSDGPALRAHLARVPGSPAAHEARGTGLLHAVLRLSGVHRTRRWSSRRFALDLACSRAAALRHVAYRAQPERPT